MKEKVGASIWDDTKMALMRAHNVVMTKKLKEISRVPSHEMVNYHIHKLIQVVLCCSYFLLLCVYIYMDFGYRFCPNTSDCQVLGKMIHITLEYLAHEEKVVVACSKMEALEAEGSCLRKDLITMMDDSNAAKEKIKALAEELKVEKLLTVQKDKQL